MMNFKSLFLLCALSFLYSQSINGQQQQNFYYTKGENNISIITMGSLRSAHCSVFEYPEFLVLHEIPSIPNSNKEIDSIPAAKDQTNPLIAFIDSIYDNKPIKYILNSHYHGHSLSTIIPFLEEGAKLVTAKENIEVYNKRGLFDNATNTDYSESIIEIDADTILLPASKYPIEVLYLKKSEYKSIPTKTFLFFNFPTQKLLAASCMVYLKDIEEKYGYKAIVYNDRLNNVKEIIADKNLDVENTLQLFRFRYENERRALPIFPIAHLQNVLENSWHRLALSEHFQNLSIEELGANQDSILNYLIECDIYQIVLNHAVYTLIDKKEYQKAVSIAQILVLFEPGKIDEIDTLGEAYFNNGQMAQAKHYDSILKASKKNIEGLGLEAWKTNQKDRLKEGS